MTRLPPSKERLRNEAIVAAAIYKTRTTIIPPKKRGTTHSQQDWLTLARGGTLPGPTGSPNYRYDHDHHQIVRETDI
jgi:hypothetical protein